MAYLTAAPTLTIVGALGRPGQSTVTVSYTIQFDAYDMASDQPYIQTVALIGDDTAVGDPPAAAPDDQLTNFAFPLQLFPNLPGTVRASMIAGPGSTLAQNHVRVISNMTLNEDQGATPNPDEIRAVVTLTPRMPSVYGPRESNLVALNL